MVYLSSRNMQAINMLSSSWATVLLTIGIIVDEWVELIPKRQKIKVNHSPWMTCCITTWPEGQNYSLGRNEWWGRVRHCFSFLHPTSFSILLWHNFLKRQCVHVQKQHRQGRLHNPPFACLREKFRSLPIYLLGNWETLAVGVGVRAA